MILKQQSLAERLRDKETREIYADEHLNSYLAAQLLTVREERGLTQKDLAARLETTQSAISRMESIHYGNWTVSRLKAMAYALGCRLKVSLETFGSIVQEVAHLDRATLTRVDAEEDPVLFPERVSMRRTMATPQPFLPARQPAPEPVRWMQQRILPWLDRRDGGIEQLKQLKTWLSGYNLPPVGDEFEPHDLIYQAIPLDEFGDGDYFRALVKRTRDLLEEQVEKGFKGPAEPVFHGNLFRLTALLKDPGAFADPLRMVYGGLKQGTLEFGTAVRAGLLSGLVWNQKDDALIQDWFYMAVDGSELLPGNSVDALRALRLVPEQRGQPNYFALAKAVKAQEILEERNNWGSTEQVRRLIEDLLKRELNGTDRGVWYFGIEGIRAAAWDFSTISVFISTLPAGSLERAVQDVSLDSDGRNILLKVARGRLQDEIAARFNITRESADSPDFRLPPPAQQILRQRSEELMKMAETRVWQN